MTSVLSKRKNNGLTGKPSNNKGKKRARKVPRKTKIDMEVSQHLGELCGDDVEEKLDFAPITACMLRQPWIDFIVQGMLERATTVAECPSLMNVLGRDHAAGETNCVFPSPADQRPAVSVSEIAWRKNVIVRNQPYSVNKVARTADRTIRSYHLFMLSKYSTICRSDCLQMARKFNESEDGSSQFGCVATDRYVASHRCGGHCLNHTSPELNSVNQARKKCHSQMIAALEEGRIGDYIRLRTECKHTGRCFINPRSRGNLLSVAASSIA